MMMLSLFFAAMLQASGVPLKTVDKGMLSRIDEPRQLSVRSADEWAKLWNEHAGERARPPVNLALEMVVGVFLGGRPTGGFGIEIVDARDVDGALVVRYRETRPARDAITPQILTAPYQIVTVPKRAGTVKFEKIE